MTDPHSDAFLDNADHPTRIDLVKTDTFDAWRDTLPEEQQAWLQRQNFTGQCGEIAWLSEDNGASVAVGWDGKDDLNTLGHLPMALPEGEYRLACDVSDLQLLGWGLGGYRFDRYKAAKRAPANLLLPENNRRHSIRQVLAATFLARDLINTPASDMTPDDLAAEARALADKFGAECTVTSGDALLDLGCGAIHAVGRAAQAPPCLIDLTWGKPEHPRIAIIGKGVTFDSGGLDLKPASGMRHMKKDMGGAATAMGLAYAVMAAGLPLRLRLLIPAAENAVAGNAFRPGDILATHKGLTVEIDNTDAEGRLLLCDALSMASADDPELIIDYATLTGSARSAVGTEIAAMFANDDELACALGTCSQAVDDPVWRMPLHAPYRHMLESQVADLVNSAASPYAGSVTAALFLQRFVDARAWVHFDIMAFNTRARPGRPEGGEAMGLRSVFTYLTERYGDA